MKKRNFQQSLLLVEYFRLFGEFRGEIILGRRLNVMYRLTLCRFAVTRANEQWHRRDTNLANEASFLECSS